MDTERISAIRKAIELVGAQAKLAELCGITQSAVSKWTRGGKITPENAILVQAATEGVVTVHDLRPDVFGSAPGSQPTILEQKAAA